MADDMQIASLIIHRTDRGYVTTVTYLAKTTGHKNVVLYHHGTGSNAIPDGEIFLFNYFGYPQHRDNTKYKSSTRQ